MLTKYIITSLSALVISSNLLAYDMMSHQLLDFTIGASHINDIGSIHSTGQHYNFDTGFTYTISHGMRLRNGFGTLLSVGYDSYQLKPNTNLQVASGQLYNSNLIMHVIYNFAHAYNINPYVFIGAGAMNAKSSIRKTNTEYLAVHQIKPILDVGFGIEYRYNKHIGINSHIKFKKGNVSLADVDTISSVTTYTQNLNLGLQYSF